MLKYFKAVLLFAKQWNLISVRHAQYDVNKVYLADIVIIYGDLKLMPQQQYRLGCGRVSTLIYSNHVTTSQPSLREAEKDVGHRTCLLH